MPTFTFPILLFYRGWSEEFRIQFKRVRFLAATQNVKEEQLMIRWNMSTSSQVFMDFSWQFWGFLVSAAFGGLRDGMAHELSKAEAKDWDVAILDAGHLVATQADKALLVRIWHGFWSGKSRDTQMGWGFLTIQVSLPVKQIIINGWWSFTMNNCNIWVQSWP